MSQHPLSEAEISDLRAQLHELQIEHRDLDLVISHLIETPPADDLLVRRLKKRKLLLKDRILQQQNLFEIIAFEIKEGKEKNPRLFDLTGLQVEANKKYGFSAESTLNSTQRTSNGGRDHLRCGNAKPHGHAARRLASHFE